MVALSAIALLASCKVLDPGLVPDGGSQGSDPDGSICREGDPEVCNNRDDDCDEAIDEGFDLMTDVAHCGGCGKSCTFVHASDGTCSAGKCQNECDEGWDDCNADTEEGSLDGCESNMNSRDTCGSCSKGCQFACSSADCVNGLALAGGLAWSCVTLSDGTARCWGNNPFGQLGIGAMLPTSPLPRAVQQLQDATRISMSFNHTCAVRQNGRASCWGLNDKGQVGDGTVLTRDTPVEIPGLQNINTIAVGLAHTCARLGSSLYCWGFNDAGQLGLGDKDDHRSPTLLPQTLTGTVIDVSAGLSHTCAARQNGQVVCWGFNDKGQVGAPGGAKGGDDSVLQPSVVDGVGGAVAVSLGHAHSCALTGVGNVLCWGWNENGQLGNNSVADSIAPVTVIMDGSGAVLTSVRKVVAGGRRTCAIRDGGEAYCWGANPFHTLGADDGRGFAPSAVRVTVTGDEAVLDISVGDNYTCFLTNKAIRCIGDNTFGQLGDGTTATNMTSGVDVAL